MKRLKERERQRYGDDIDVGGKRYESSQKFFEWALKYDGAGIEIRSKALHEEWLARLPCRVLRLEGDLSVDEKVEYIEEIINV